MTLVTRPNLDQRDPRVLSKSALTTFDLCGHKAWYSLHDPRPAMPTERMVFGSAMDAAIEQVAVALRASLRVNVVPALAAAAEVGVRDGVEIDMAEIERGVELFAAAVAPKYDWAYCAVQPTIRLDLAGFGPCDTHPDVVLRSGIYDVKTAHRAKEADAARTSLELGFYALMREAETGAPVERVGYWTWVRSGRPRPYWQVLEAPVTDEMRRRTRARAAAYIRARNADLKLTEAAERRGVPAQNYTFPSGPRFAGLCTDCQWAPAHGGPCPLAMREESDATAA